MADPQSGWTLVQPATDAQAAGWEPVSAPAKPKSWLDSVGDYLSESLQSLKPTNIINGVNQTVLHPVDTVKALGNAQGDLERKAEEAFKKGDYAAGMAHALYYLLPVIGPRLDQAGEQMRQGEYAKGLGATTDVALQLAGPELAARGLSAGQRVLSNLKPPAPSPELAAAVAFGQREGIPVDAATATGSDVVRSIQKKASDSMGGAGVAEKFKAQQSNRLATVGEQLAAKANEAPMAGPLQPGDVRPMVPGPAVTAEQAGTKAQNAVRNVVHDQNVAAGDAYTTLRDIENRPQNQKTVTLAGPDGDSQVPMALPVDLRATKSALTDMYSRLKAEGDVAPLMGQKADAARILNRIVTGPDYAPLSVVDAALSDLKSFIRADNPDLRTPGQASIVDAVKKLDSDVRATAQGAGPDAVRALDTGRKATQAKYVAADILKGLETGSGEPVAAYNRLTARGDAGISQLRDLAKQSPQVLPDVGRALMDGLMDKATADGGFGHAAAVRSQWMKLGPQTKTLLFRDPAYVSNVDNFFRLAEKIAENPNPSGTARLNNLFNATSAVIGYPISKLMYSPAGVKLLTQGLSLPQSTAATSAWVARVKQLATTAQGAGRVGQLQATGPVQ